MTEQKLPFSQWNPIIAENFVKKWEGLSLKPPARGQSDMATQKASNQGRLFHFCRLKDFSGTIWKITQRTWRLT